jgi:serine protease
MRRCIRFSALAGMALLYACTEVSSPSGEAPSYTVTNPGASRDFIVVLAAGTEDVRPAAEGLVRAHNGQLGFVYEHALRGFSARLPLQAAEALRNNPKVALVEEDIEVSIAATQLNATWGLDRIDQRDLPLSGTYRHDGSGAGVRLYVIDTGIRSTHADFGGRVAGGYTNVADDRGTEDCNGHGTHAAGTAGGATWGVAKSVTLVPVRVLNCNASGTASAIIAGVDWVTANHVKPAVVNMSLSLSASDALDQAVSNSIAAGVTYVIAAGNNNASACSYSPARVGTAVTVGATTNTDARASYSNFGSCLDLFAPGSSVTSAWFSSDAATNSLSGTSMAAPHVAGVAALILGNSPGSSPATVASTLASKATTGKVTSAGSGSPNLLLYMGFLNGPNATPIPNAVPTASFSFSCSSLACTFDGRLSSDSDGTIASYAWQFGDGATATGATASRTYAAAGTYTVRLTVTDNAGATGSTTDSVGATAPAPSIVLTVTLSEAIVKGKLTKYANLSWTGAAGSVDVYRNNKRATSVTGTSWRDTLGTGTGTRTYKVCNNGSTTACSQDVTITF